jgi:enoyl-CoA hydratase/carnithine racemase
MTTTDTRTRSVTYEVRDEIAWLTIDRPESRNALSRDVRAGLLAGFERFNADEGAKVLVLTATGQRAFCAGGDLKEMAEEGLTVPPIDYVPQPGRTIQVDKPTIAAVNGAALAGGFLLVQSCDLCIAADTATFGVTEVKVGRGAPWAVPLSYLVPPRVAMEILLTGDPISAERARELGLVNDVVPAADLVESAQQLALRIAANAPLSVRAAKRTVRLLAEHPLAEAFDEAERLWEPVYRSRDAQEGPAAFREKRRPVWEGR